MPLARVTITIPDDLLEAADRKAAELDRSRSWLLVEALRRYLVQGARKGSMVREPSASYLAGLGPGRQAQLEADLALSPEERVRLAQETAEIRAGLRRRSPLRHRIMAFDRLEDFFDWEKREAIDV